MKSPQRETENQDRENVRENVNYPRAKAIIAMSGGVDSSVAALLTMEQGYDCVGVTMKLFDNADVGADENRSCCSLDDAEDARAVAYSLGMPFYIFDFSEDFRREVIGRFITEYARGCTPNPCIDCNRYIKYERLFGRMESMGFDFVVTGHYAKIDRDENGRYLLRRAADLSKDQSYVLYTLTQKQLAHTLFPNGALHKTEIRSIAEAHGFVNARKKDSQDICFVRGDYGEFIENYTGREFPAGDFVDAEGKTIGRHDGIVHYTIGQRKGLGAWGSPKYVTEIRAAENQVVLGENDALFLRELTASQLNLIAADSIEAPRPVHAQIRYSHKAASATLTQTDEDRVHLVFDEAQRAITRGQAVVFYDGDVVLGGGVIE